MHYKKCAKCVSSSQKSKIGPTARLQKVIQTHFSCIINPPCHSQLFQSNQMPPSSAAFSLCSVPVVPALQSRDQTWQCNSTEGCKKGTISMKRGHKRSQNPLSKFLPSRGGKPLMLNFRYNMDAHHLEQHRL